MSTVDDGDTGRPAGEMDTISWNVSPVRVLLRTVPGPAGNVLGCMRGQGMLFPFRSRFAFIPEKYLNFRRPALFHAPMIRGTLSTPREVFCTRFGRAYGLDAVITGLEPLEGDAVVRCGAPDGPDAPTTSVPGGAAASTPAMGHVTWKAFSDKGGDRKPLVIREMVRDTGCGPDGISLTECDEVVRTGEDVTPPGLPPLSPTAIVMAVAGVEVLVMSNHLHVLCSLKPSEPEFVRGTLQSDVYRGGGACCAISVVGGGMTFVATGLLDGSIAVFPLHASGSMAADYPLTWGSVLRAILSRGSDWDLKQHESFQLAVREQRKLQPTALVSGGATDIVPGIEDDGVVAMVAAQGGGPAGAGRIACGMLGGDVVVLDLGLDSYEKTSRTWTESSSGPWTVARISAPSPPDGVGDEHVAQGYFSTLPIAKVTSIVSVTSMCVREFFLFVGYSSGVVRMIDLVTCGVVFEVDAGAFAVVGLAVHPTKPYLAVGTRGAVVRIFWLPLQYFSPDTYLAESTRDVKSVTAVSVVDCVCNGLAFHGDSLVLASYDHDGLRVFLPNLEGNTNGEEQE